MEYRPLGRSDLRVSAICLGTMTYGQQNTVQEAHEQLNYAVAQGINFIDTAEMYPVPARAETQGRTEAYIGSWLARQERDRLIIATKATGPGPHMAWMRGGDRNLNRTNLEQAVNDSLKRLQTDYIDLYQLHWPDRYVALFGAPNYDPQQERETVPIAEQLQVLADLVTAGKIRSIGLSNETPWGVSQFCHIAEQLNLPRIVAIQNAYNLTNRVFDIHLAETCHREQIGLLAYSPLAFGFLTGKHRNGKAPNSRLALFPGFDRRYQKPNLAEAVAAYGEIAQRHGLTLTQLALGFVQSRWCVTSTIIGATNLTQLQENIATATITLTPEMIADIETIHHRYPNPTP